MRIGLDASPLAVPTGGIARYTAKLVEGLPRVDDRHRYVLYGAPRGLGAGDVPAGVSLDPVRFPFKPLVDTVHLLGARRRIDLFHGTNYFVPLATRVPSVMTVHDLTVQLTPELHPPARRRWHRLLPLLCRRARRVIADSHHTKSDLIRLLGVPDEKVDVIHLGVDRALAPVHDPAELERVRRRYALPERFVLHLGALEPRKNLASLVRAMAALQRDGLAERLVLAGCGDADYVRTLRAAAIEAGMTPDRDVFFPGYVEEADLASVYSASRLFAFPSHYEGFGLPPLEAMACGVPVVLAHNSSLGELYTGSCVLVEDPGPPALARALRETLADTDLRRELSRRGLKQARSRTWDRVAEETLAVYERALS